MRKLILAAKIALAASVVAPLGIAPVQAQFAVIDVASVKQNTITALQSVAATAKQVEQYRTQLQQYQNQLQNTVAPSAYLWQQANKTIDGLQNSVNQLNFLKQQTGGIDQYLNQFKNPNAYSSSPCFGPNGCSPEQRAALNSANRAKTATAMAANANVMRGIDAQQSQLQADSRMLDTLQSRATTAKGQMEALGYANQFAAKQAGELQQIRGLLMAQNAAVAAQQQYALDRQAADDAARQQAHKVRSSQSRTYTN